jgi:hypothetical protein
VSLLGQLHGQQMLDMPKRRLLGVKKIRCNGEIFRTRGDYNNKGNKELAIGLFQHSRIKLVYAVEMSVNDTERLLECIDVNIQTKTEDVYEKFCD